MIFTHSMKIQKDSTLRTYIRSILHEGKEGLTGAVIMRRDARKQKMIQYLQNEQPFTLSDGRKVVITPDDANKLIQTIESGSGDAYNAAFSNKSDKISAYVLDADGNKKPIPDSPGEFEEIIIDKPSILSKTQDFGGRGGKESAAEKNESGFANIINSLTQDGESPINVKIGNASFSGVTSADHVGGKKAPDGMSSKSDVVLNTSEGPIGLSFKLPSAEYYLSGDDQLADFILPILDMIDAQKSKNLSIAKNVSTKKGSVLQNAIVSDEPIYRTDDSGNVKKDKKGKPIVARNSGEPVDLWFEIPEDIAYKAIAGVSDENKIDYIVKGNMDAQPKDLGNDTYAWSASILDARDKAALMKSINQNDRPVGLIRHDVERGGGLNRRGLRPAVVSYSRAKSSSAVSIDDLIKNEIPQFGDIQLRQPKALRKKAEKEAATPQPDQLSAARAKRAASRPEKQRKKL